MERDGGLCRKNDAGKRLQNSDEMWLMYYKWNLRTTCNAILDFSVHANNMSKNKRCIYWLEAFNSKRKRMENGIELPYQVQLCSYFTGYTEIYDFRERLKRRKM
jgi:hypothetical protein